MPMVIMSSDIEFRSANASIERTHSRQCVFSAMAILEVCFALYSSTRIGALRELPILLWTLQRTGALLRVDSKAGDLFVFIKSADKEQAIVCIGHPIAILSSVAFDLALD
jgi:hypothetical protein